MYLYQKSLNNLWATVAQQVVLLLLRFQFDLRLLLVLEHDSPIVRHMFCHSKDSIYTVNQASGSGKVKQMTCGCKKSDGM